MTLRQYLLFMSALTLVAWGLWLLLLLNFHPNTSGALTFFFFYATLLLALTGAWSIAGLLVRRGRVSGRILLFRAVRRAFRQGVLLSTLMVGTLFLHGMRFLTWWNALILVALIAALEAFYLTRRDRPAKELQELEQDHAIGN